jgi:hypothetical protein
MPKDEELKALYARVVTALYETYFLHPQKTRILIKANGLVQRFHAPLTFKEIETLIRASALDHVNLKDGVHCMYVDDFGASKPLPFNFLATALYFEKCGGPVDWFLKGDVVVVPHSDYSEEEPDPESDLD